MRIGVMCSGGDAPGMNPCIRGVARTALAAGHEVIGIYRGYQGILDESFFTAQDGEQLMRLRSVSNLSMMGGTILHSSRCPDFRLEEGQKKAAANLRKHGIDGLVAIGGNGTLSGAIELMRHWDGQVIGCPGTIDNDLKGTDYTIGFSTAVETAVEAVDKLRDTAASHDRMFLVEVMGRHSGYIGLYTAIAAGAEVAAIPELDFSVEQILEKLHSLKERGKTSLMMIVAEGVQGGAQQLNELLKEHKCPFPTRVLSLGHLQRGGRPNAFDRILGAQLGHHATLAIMAGETGKMSGLLDDVLTLTPFEEAVEGHKAVPPEMIDLLDTLAK